MAKKLITTDHLLRSFADIAWAIIRETQDRRAAKCDRQIVVIADFIRQSGANAISNEIDKLEEQVWEAFQMPSVSYEFAEKYLPKKEVQNG